MSLRENIESGNFTMEQLSQAFHDKRKYRLMDAEDLIRQAGREETEVDPEIEALFGS